MKTTHNETPDERKSATADDALAAISKAQASLDALVRMAKEEKPPLPSSDDVERFFEGIFNSKDGKK